MPADSVSGEAVLSLCPQWVVEGAKGSLEPHYKGTNPIHGETTLTTESPPKGPTSSPFTLGARI